MAPDLAHRIERLHEALEILRDELGDLQRLSGRVLEAVRPLLD